MPKTIALFDFDGTITNKDSLFHFLAFICPSSIHYYLTLLKCLPTLLAFKFGWRTSTDAKQRVFSKFCKGMKINVIKAKAGEYTKTELPNIIREKALQKIFWHLSNEHRVVLVSASLDIWLQPWCTQMNIELISTKIEVKQGVVTGSFATKNCNKQEKVSRIKAQIDLDQYDSIFAYGDSKGDSEMLALTENSAYKPFH